MKKFSQLWSDLSLRFKTASLMSLLVLVSVISLTFLSIEREQYNFRRELENQADLFLETTSLSIRDQLYRLQLDELVEIARSVSDNPNVTMFIVYDADGRVLADSTQAELAFSQVVDPLGKKLVVLAAGDVYMSWEQDQLVSGRAVVLGNQVIGAVATGLSTAPLDEKITVFTLQGLGLAAVALLIGSLLTVLFARQITNPLSELADVASKMAAGDLSISVHPYSRDEVGRLGETFNQMAAGLREREWLRDMFGRFVSRDVADAIRSGQVRLEGENRVVSVLFCDIREFTDFSERHSPREVVAMLNEYLPLIVQSAQKHGGMVNKFGGDSTLIIYGAPREVEHSAYQAVLTALDIRAGLARLNENLRKKGDTLLRVGIGINTGVALAGAVGPNERQEYTVIGNTVNLAARIDGLNKQFPQHDILISSWTRDALGTHREEFEMVSLGVVPIRGKNEPVEIWAVKSKR